MSLSMDEIRNFVTAWYKALDQHVAPSECAKLVAEDRLEMIFPEKTLHGVSDFLAWYAGGTYSDGSTAPGVINIFFDENHNVVSVEGEIKGNQATLEVVVAWQASWFDAPAAKSKRTSLDATQRWIVRGSTRNEYGLEVISYNAMAQPFKYSPGFARL
ncbi:MAG: hypothetical protein WAV05_12375 [Anaerolineales bacterium]